MKTAIEIEKYLREEALPESWRNEFVSRIEDTNPETKGDGPGISLTEYIRKHVNNPWSLISDAFSWGSGEERDKWAVFSQRYIDWLKGYEDTAKWVYRLESIKPDNGLWYSGRGDWCFETGIGSLGDECKTKALGMSYDARYKRYGRSWFSSCSRKEDLMHWYSKEDAKNLLERGFVFTRYLATEYYEYPQETTFIKHTSLKREVIDFDSLWEPEKS